MFKAIRLSTLKCKIHNGIKSIPPEHALELKWNRNTNHLISKTFFLGKAHFLRKMKINYHNLFLTPMFLKYTAEYGLTFINLLIGQPDNG